MERALSWSWLRCQQTTLRSRGAGDATKWRYSFVQLSLIIPFRISSRFSNTWRFLLFTCLITSTVHWWFFKMLLVTTSNCYSDWPLSCICRNSSISSGSFHNWPPPPTLHTIYLPYASFFGCICTDFRLDANYKCSMADVLLMIERMQLDVRCTIFAVLNVLSIESSKSSVVQSAHQGKHLKLLLCCCDRTTWTYFWNALRETITFIPCCWHCSILIEVLFMTVLWSLLLRLT